MIAELHGSQCLSLMDRVAADGGEVIVTKRGRAVARLVPAAPASATARIMASMAARVVYVSDIAPWELLLKAQRGRFALPVPARAWIDRALAILTWARTTRAVPVLSAGRG